MTTTDISVPIVPSGQLGNLQRVKLRYIGVARRTLGILLLLVTVIFWTASNFLASFIFADNTYSKPFFVTYVNTAFFAVALVPIFLNQIRRDGYSTFPNRIVAFWKGRSSQYAQVSEEPDQQCLKLDDDDEDTLRSRSPSNRLLCEDGMGQSQTLGEGDVGPYENALTLQETARLSLEFCILWFVANYFIAACLEHTTVASATILTSTSSIWTLLLGALIKVEKFSVKKLLGVLASLVGIVLTSSVDIGSDNDDNRGSFPHKSHMQLAVGDGMAFFSAIMYGVYTTLMKKRIRNEARVNMPLFFGLVGLFNVLLLWPGFFILHYTGEETFQLPPTGQVWLIVLVNSAISLVSDFTWAYSILLTSPLVVTVGISLTIPLSLVGQMVLNQQYSSASYWVGAGIVFLSFIFINRESKEDEIPEHTGDPYLSSQ